MSDPTTDTPEAAQPPVGKHWYYICDACGSIVTIASAPIPEDQDWACADCGSNAMWEFTNQAHAMQHSRHIQSLHRSGLLRKSQS